MRLSYLRICILLVFLVSFLNIVSANDTTDSPVRIAVLAPFYLDSAFHGNDYNLSNVKIPQYFLSGLEFYNGVMLAIDSLKKENANIEVWIYDTHKKNQPILQLMNEMQTMNFSLVLASVSSVVEQKTISDFSATNSIPVISATFPTDAYLVSNPFFLMINPTWKTHVAAIYDYFKNNYKKQKIIYFTRKGGLEDRVWEEFKTLNANHNINFSNIVLNDNFSEADVLSHLDSTKQNIVLCGSLNENFGRLLLQNLNNNGESYSTVVMGMPTWSGLPEITGETADKIQILISTPYKFSTESVTLDTLSNEYKNSFFTKPSDMVYKGFESMYHFTKLLLKHPDDFINQSSDTSFTISSNYSFEPVRLSKSSLIPDYLENKKIYFIKIVDGKVQSIQ